jgi:hypothetical protein
MHVMAAVTPSPSTLCKECSRDRLRKIDPGAARISEALLREAGAGNIMGLMMMFRDLGEGRIPPEVKGQSRPDCDTLTFEKFSEVWEGVYRVSDDQTQHMMVRLRPLLEWQLGFRNHS